MKIYIICCVPANTAFGKNLVSEIYAKLLSANQIARFLNQLFLQNKLMKQPNFLTCK